MDVGGYACVCARMHVGGYACVCVYVCVCVCVWGGGGGGGTHVFMWSVGHSIVMEPALNVFTLWAIHCK